MSASEGDPLRDPRFPDRPQTPDFWRLSETALMLDALMVTDIPVPDLLGQFADTEALTYVVQMRTAALLRGAGVEAPRVFEVLMQTAMMGGLCHGIAFQRAGGKRDE